MLFLQAAMRITVFKFHNTTAEITMEERRFTICSPVLFVLLLFARLLQMAILRAELALRRSNFRTIPSIVSFVVTAVTHGV